MKLFAKLMLAALIIAMLLPFTLLKKDDGSTWMSFSNFELPDFSTPSLPNVPKVDSITDSAGLGTGEVEIYEWIDSEGAIQFSNQPPPAGVEYQVRQFDPNANVIQSVELPAEEAETAAVEAQESGPGDAQESASPYTPEGVKKLMDDAKNVEKLLNQRFQSQESAIN